MALTKISTAMISQSAAAVDLNVDAGTFYVDTTNNRVGVGGKTDPDTPLHVIGTVTATTFAGSGASLTSIPNSALTNSSITINSTATSLGGSITLGTDDVAEGSSNLYYTDARVDARISGGSLGNITTTGYIRGPSSFTIDPAAHGDNTGTVVIAGNLQVDGTTTTINSTTMTVDDKNITLASGSANAAAANGAGLTVDIGTGTNPTITYDGTNDEWDFNKDINVTGSVTANGLTVANTGFARITLQDSDATNQKGYIDSSGGDLNLTSQNGTSHGDIFLKRYNGTSTILSAQFANNGDISFYEDTGTNAKLFWDASEERLGIGTSSPNVALEVDGGTANGSIARFHNENTRYLEISAESDGTYDDAIAVFKKNTSVGQYAFRNSTTEYMRIDASGNVGIGTSSPGSFHANASNLVVGSGSGTEGITINSGTSSYGVIYFADGTSGSATYSGNINYNHDDNSMRFGTAGSTTSVVIDDSGKVGIGIASPAAKLHVQSTGSDGVIVRTTTNAEPFIALQRNSGSNGVAVLRSIDGGDLRIDTGATGAAQVTKMTIEAGGNVGIGTTSPRGELELESNGVTTLYLTRNDTSINNTNSLGVIRFSGTEDGSTYITGAQVNAKAEVSWSSGDYKTGLVFSTNPGNSVEERMRIDSSGNVIINKSNFTSLPTGSKLNIFGDGVTLRLDGSSQTTKSILFRQTSVANPGEMYADGSLRLRTEDASTRITFHTNSTGSNNERMRVDANGNVGIGETTPFAKLHVKDTGWSSGSPYGTVQLIEGKFVNDQNWGHLVITDEETGSGQGGSIRFATGPDSSLNPFAGIQGVAEGTSYGGLGLYTRPNGGTATERMRIASDGSLSTPTAGTSNVRFGVNAGNSIASGGNYNVAVGDEALTANATGTENVAVGYNALPASTSASQNTAVGASALLNNDSGQYNSAVGREALKYNTSGAYNTAMGRTALAGNTGGSNNTAFGYNTLSLNADANFNVAIGGNAMVAQNAGGRNTAVGYNALSNDTKGARNVAIGWGSLNNSNQTSVTTSYNVAVGYNAGNDITTGTENTLIGGLAGDSLTVAFYNTAVGFEALSNDLKGYGSTAIGHRTLQAQQFGGATTAYNTAVGYIAGSAVTTGIKNTLVGGLSGSSVTSGSKNTIVGGFDGNQDSVDIRTSDNHVILSDGDGNVEFHADRGNSLYTIGDIEEYREKVLFTNNVAYTRDINILNTTGQGNFIEVLCGYNHYYNTTYGAWRYSLVNYRSSGNNSLITTDDIKNHSSTGGGSWTITLVNNGAKLRITKTAGTYIGAGYGWILVRQIK